MGSRSSTIENPLNQNKIVHNERQFNIKDSTADHSEMSTMSKIPMKNLRSQTSSTVSEFYLACRNASLSRVRGMLKSMTRDELSRVEPNGSTALHAACYYGHVDIVMMLLRKGVDRTVKNKYNCVPYEEAANDEIKKLFHIIPSNNQVIDSTATLNCIQFILVNLSSHLTPLASEMLRTLISFTGDTIISIDNIVCTSAFTKYNKTLIIFTTDEFYSTMDEKPKELLQLYVLKTEKNKIDQGTQFTSVEDLIFQLVDEVSYYYQWETKSDATLGHTYSAQEKEKCVSNIHVMLENIHKQFSAIQTPIGILPILIYLTSSSDNMKIKSIKELFDSIVTKSLLFDDQHSCYQYLQDNKKSNSIFLIVDGDYDDTTLNQMNNFIGVKKVYQCKKSMMKSDTTVDQYSEWYFDLTHDLIILYNKLATQYKNLKDYNNAKDMFLKAHQLSQILMKF